MRQILTLAIVFCAGAVRAQLALPPVKLPEVRLPVDVGRTVSEVKETVDLRPLRVQELLRTQRAVIESDPRGEPIVRAELLAFSPSTAALERARAAGFAVARERALEGLEARIVVLLAPPGMSTRRALQRLKKLDPEGSYDFNHIYMESGAAGAAVAKSPVAQTRIGLIDGGVDIAHPVFNGRVIHRHGCADKPTAHGTAVASLLNAAELYAADVYCGSPTGGAVDAVAEAFGWFSREKVTVINVSLVGPPNVLLGQVVRLMIARGHLIVAAVGNDGPHSKPLYPAAYPGVIGVTGIDARHRVLPEAVRGKQVMFAARGADFEAAVPGGGSAGVRGTSFAAPIVAGLLAAFSLEQLKARAVDLGAPGVDTTYGYGLVE